MIKFLIHISKIKVLFVLIFISSCANNELNGAFRNDFTKEEYKIIETSKKIIEKTYFATFITVDVDGQPRARVMEPFAPDSNFIIWLATNPKSRKVIQLKNNNRATLHYYDKAKFSYVSLMGNAFLVNDQEIKSKKFKEGWEKFYKNQQEDYLLIKFVPKTLEMISIPNQYSGDSITWKPHQVILRK